MGWEYTERLERQRKVAKEAYGDMLNHFLNEIEQVDHKTPGNLNNIEPQWWLDMMEIRALVKVKLHNEEVPGD